MILAGDPPTDRRNDLINKSAEVVAGIDVHIWPVIARRGGDKRLVCLLERNNHISVVVTAV